MGTDCRFIVILLRSDVEIFLIKFDYSIRRHRHYIQGKYMSGKQILKERKNVLMKEMNN